ncbi:hypothetical protein BKA81DRAFT_380382 [Phyllosticta paracitricarpa]|uniref:Uncharacterized protein n=1 Tax=Phyllosticta citricarpa TaxID=55181 RepID=A0ABR1LZ17_9PEZI
MPSFSNNPKPTSRFSAELPSAFHTRSAWTRSRPVCRCLTALLTASLLARSLARPTSHTDSHVVHLWLTLARLPASSKIRGAPRRITTISKEDEFARPLLPTAGILLRPGSVRAVLTFTFEIARAVRIGHQSALHIKQTYVTGSHSVAASQRQPWFGRAPEKGNAQRAM